MVRGKTILVTGATGFLGGALIHRLSDEGAYVRALARRPGRDRYIRELPGVEIVMGAITDLDRMRDVSLGCDYVVHTAAALSGSLTAQMPVNETGTRNITIAAAESKLRRLVHVSSIAVYGYGYKDAIISEESSFTESKDSYVYSKRAAEQMLLKTAASSGLRSYSIIRPGMIYGPRSSFWTKKLFRHAKRRPMPWLGTGEGYCFPIYVDDVVDLIVTLLTHPNAHERVFNCAPDPAPTWRAFLQGYQALIDRENWLTIPADLVIALLDTLTLFQKPAFLEFVRYSQTRNTYSMRKADEVLNWKPSVDLIDGIQHCIPYLKDKGLLS